MKTYVVKTRLSTIENFSGSLIEAWMFSTIPLPSKSNTATPKKNGKADGVK